jgi:hypothetical protein
MILSIEQFRLNLLNIPLPMIGYYSAKISNLVSYFLFGFDMIMSETLVIYPKQVHNINPLISSAEIGEND